MHVLLALGVVGSSLLTAQQPPVTPPTGAGGSGAGRTRGGRGGGAVEIARGRAPTDA